MANFGPWASFAETNTLDQLVHMIYTNRNADTVSPSEDVAQVLADLPTGARVLDFGCGVCRNAADYAIRFPHLDVHAYDSPQMLTRADEFVRHRHGRTVCEIPNLHTRDNWNEISGERFDCVYATLVFQHIHPDEIVFYVESIKKMTSLFVVFGRRANDYWWDGSTWRVFEACGLIPSNADEIGYSATGSPEEHLPLCVYRLA